MAPFEDPEFLNPDQRVPLCLNPPAVRTHLRLTFKTTELAMAGQSKTQMFHSIKSAYDRKELPLPEPGAMCYMMSKRHVLGRGVLRLACRRPSVLSAANYRVRYFGVQVVGRNRCTQASAMRRESQRR